MAAVEERVAGLEARMDEQKDQIGNLREEITEFRAETRADFTATRSEMARCSETDALRASMERGFERLDQKIDKHFMWLVGIMVTGFLTGFGTMVTLFLRVLDRLP